MVTFLHRACAGAFALGLAVLFGGCGEEGLLPTTVDPGADFEIANVVFDEGFFYCQVEPRTLFASSCGSGDAAQGESSGSCHASVTSFHFTNYTPHVADTCSGNVPGGVIPAEARGNYQSASGHMRRDPESAPLLMRPTKKLEHPRKIFDENSDAANAIREWATRVSTQ